MKFIARFFHILIIAVIYLYLLAVYCVYGHYDMAFLVLITLILIIESVKKSLIIDELKRNFEITLTVFDEVFNELINKNEKPNNSRDN